MKPIRVIHLLHSMNRGGTENTIMNYYRAIDRNKVQFDFLLTDSNKSDFEDEIIALGGRIFRVRMLTLKNPFKYICDVRRFLKSHPEYKIIHSHTSSKSVIPLTIAKLQKIPVRIAHSHSSQSETGLTERIREFLKPFLKHTANQYLACSEIASKWLYGSSFTKNGSVKIVKNVIDAERFRYDANIRKKIRLNLGIDDGSFVIGQTARFSPVKNHLFSIEILKEAIAINSNTILLLVGDGNDSQRESIISYAKELGVYENVKMVGVVPNVYDYNQAMDAFILPSLYEGFGLAIVESQISGLPSFTTKDKVPEECSVTDLVTFLPLEAGAKAWAERIINTSCKERTDRYEDVKTAGYDSTSSAGDLQDWYLQLAQNNINNLC